MTRTRLIVAVVFVLLVAAGATAYSFLAPKRYDATARVVVHPIAADDATFTGIDVLRDTGDQSRTLATAASYFQTPDVLHTVAVQLGRSHVDVAVKPLAGANVLLVVGRSGNPSLAAQIANGVMQEGIGQRTARFQAQVGAALAKLAGATDAASQRRALDLRVLQSRPDPTVEALSTATAPTKAAWPDRTKIVAGSVLAALLVAALVLLLLSLRRERPDESAAAELALRAETSAEIDHAFGIRERRLAERERILGARERALAQRESELERAVENAREQLRALDERSAEVERREAELVARSHEVPEPPAAPADGWTIPQLEQLVAARGGEHPDRLDEWRYTVRFLSEHADEDGALPPAFDGLVAATFSELL